MRGKEGSVRLKEGGREEETEGGRDGRHVRRLESNRGFIVCGSSGREREQDEGGGRRGGDEYEEMKRRRRRGRDRVRPPNQIRSTVIRVMMSTNTLQTKLIHMNQSLNQCHVTGGEYKFKDQ